MTDVKDLDRRGVLAHMHLKAQERRAKRVRDRYTHPRPHQRPQPPTLATRKAGRHLGQIRALWRTLGYLGVLPYDDEEALKAYIRKHWDVPHPARLTVEEGADVIQHFKDWTAREGVIWPGQYEGRTPGMGERRAVALCLWSKLAGAGLVIGDSEDAMATYLSHAGLPFSTRTYSFGDWDKALSILGKMWRPQALRLRMEAHHG